MMQIWMTIFKILATNWRRNVVVFLVGWMLVLSSLALIGTWNNPTHRAVLCMAWGLILLWIGGCGFTMWYWRDFWCRLASHWHWHWMLKFILGSTFLILVEEIVTTLMTNCAPLFGVPIGQAYITASTNYLDVVMYHSVVVIAPMFVGWAVMLWRWKFSPFAVFILFGLTGLLAETISFGLQNLGSFAFWIFVYGLMVWLPAHWVPEDRVAHEPRWWVYPLAVIVPFFFVPLAAVFAPWIWLTPKHPTAHFPPIGGL